MTDNEIIKALECCSSGSYGCENGCPLDKDCDSPIKGGEKIMKSALNLINRQEAEIEGLSDLLKRHQRHTKSIRILTAETAKKIKAEAYKEFAEELKPMIHESDEAAYRGGWDYSEEDVFEAIDKLLERKVGENDG